MKQTVRRVRHQHQAPLANPVCLEQLQIPDNKTLKGENFLLYDSGPGPHRFLIFSTIRNLQLFAESRHWFADGTFKSTPPRPPSFVSTDLHDTRTTVQHRNSSCLRFDERQKHKDVYVKKLTELKNLNSNPNPEIKKCRLSPWNCAQP